MTKAATQSILRISDRQLAIQFCLIALYVSANLVWRWLRWPLFSGHGAFGWPQPDALALGQLIAVNLTPVWVISYLLYRAVACRPTASINFLALAFLLLGLVTIEIDLSWYQMSAKHIRWTDVEIFLTEDWKQHFGIQGSDIQRTLLVVLFHGIALVGAFGASTLVASRAPSTLETWLPHRRIGRMLVLVLVLDFGTTSVHVLQGSPQWLDLIDRNPLRVAVAPRIVEAFSPEKRDLAAANVDFEALSSSPPARAGAGIASQPETPAQIGPPLDVLLLVLEGFNANLTNAATMPFLHTLAEQATVASRHYSTGNITAYGILGLIFGRPLDFYAGAKTELASVSRYIDVFSDRGYRSRQITDPLTDYRYMGEYLGNFTEAPIESEDHWELLPEIVADLKHEQPTFVFAYYYGTHYPYHHREGFDLFQPEVPEGYDYSGWNVRDDKQRIINAYKNCLLEADAWLRDLVSQIDLERTILIVTGDHGEEMYETNRLGHASTLGEAQIRVPLFVLVPGGEGARIETVTSHLDVMPTLFDALGWPRPEARYGESLWIESRSGAAIVAKNNGRRLPDHWAVVTEAGKSVVRFDAREGLSIAALRDESENSVSYRESRNTWKPNLALAKKLESDLFDAKAR